MDHHRIYLSGPISGFTFAEATEWRNDVYETLSDYAEILDPMRNKTAPADTTVEAESVSALDPTLLSDHGIVTRDYNDTKTSTILFVNFLGARKASIGSIVELAWAYEMRIPTVVIMEPTGNVHDHAFVRELTGFRVDTVERAISVTKSIMGVSAEYDPFDAWVGMDDHESDA